jgi:hypothetical protein
MNTMNASSTVSIRLATEADAATLQRLAALDGKPALRGTILIAEADGVPLAAWSTADQRHVADPFAPTAGLVSLLRSRAELLRAPSRRSRGPGRRLRRLRASHA